MESRLCISATAILLLLTAAGTALAGPSNQIWIPSTDTQAFRTADLGIDNFFRASAKSKAPPNAAATRDANTMDIGLTFGVLPFEKFRMEAGFDLLLIANNPNDQHPWSGNIKAAIPEDALFSYSPALAVGLYNARPVKDIATKDAPNVTSGQNIVYGLVAETMPPLGAFPSLGRFSAGYYRGAKRALRDENDRADNHGVLLSWDRTLSEISDRLWLGLDYQGGDNIAGAFNVGFSWAFAKNVWVLFGYDVHTQKRLSGSNTFTTQVDINFP